MNPLIIYNSQEVLIFFIDLKDKLLTNLKESALSETK